LKNPQAYRVYLTLSVASTLFNAMMFTVLTVYYVRVGGLNPLQLVLVGTVMEITEFIFEIPTGIVADTYSRRLSVIIGTFVTGAAFVLVALVDSFPLLALGSAIYGLGATFLSGAREAWIVDEVGEEHVRQVFLRVTQWRRLAALLGTFVSVALASFQLNLPILLGGSLTLLLGIYLLWVMPETGFQPIPHQHHQPWHNMRSIWQNALHQIRSHSIFPWLIFIAVTFGVYSEAFDRLGDAHFLIDFTLPSWGNLDAVVWFGVINAGSQVLGFVVAGSAARRRTQNTAATTVRVLTMLQILWIASVLVFALTPSFPLALAAYWAVAVMSTLHGPLYAAWVNQYLQPSTRATTLSLLNQADALGQLTGGPVIGAIGTTFSIRVALVVAGVVLSPAILLYARVQAITKQGTDASTV
jgi:DHA3 family tetracycline resistance protein-like MFS transporter